ncbi:hypothetical protein UFOVP621_61 [uncultured Caudovirales phage]|uniref:Uncharacterized protein n=1 Tax=uncultured Caudovirales phage TaxID=2100421 RepID=A0A6J5N856_9CAUD|nr:hypothetical protein UFOVP621_61 [uncultured Caudovirales phage]
MQLKENQFRGVCVDCGGVVRKGEGYVLGKRGRTWDIQHKQMCNPSAVKEADNNAKLENEGWSSPAHEGDIDMDYHGKQRS